MVSVSHARNERIAHLRSAYYNVPSGSCFFDDAGLREDFLRLPILEYSSRSGPKCIKSLNPTLTQFISLCRVRGAACTNINLWLKDKVL